MAGSNHAGGLGALIWMAVGLLVGLVLGWWYGTWLAYAGIGLVFGWLGGLALAGPENDDGQH